jgi:NADPH-dependent 7-cyano-7-deazaguanine reductase QueF
VILIWRKKQKRRLASAWLVTYSHSFRNIIFFKELIRNKIFQDRINSLPLMKLFKTYKTDN